MEQQPPDAGRSEHRQCRGRPRSEPVGAGGRSRPVGPLHPPQAMMTKAADSAKTDLSCQRSWALFQSVGKRRIVACRAQKPRRRATCIPSLPTCLHVVLKPILKPEDPIDARYHSSRHLFVVFARLRAPEGPWPRNAVGSGRFTAPRARTQHGCYLVPRGNWIFPFRHVSMDGPVLASVSQHGMHRGPRVKISPERHNVRLSTGSLHNNQSSQ